MKPTPILFMDMDGTVRHGKDEIGHFVNSAADVEIFSGVLDILRSYKARGWRIVGISNQGGIALGHVDERDVSKAMEETNRLCARLFDRTLYCPHHPNAKGDELATTEEKSICFCRKPRIGMVVSSIMSLAQQFSDEYYRPYSCLFVGDRDEDRQCADNANIPFMLASDWRSKGPLSSD